MNILSGILYLKIYFNGYFLHIKNEDDLNGATVSFYDGLGNDDKGYAFPVDVGLFLNQNEYLLSENGRYKFFVQDTGNRRQMAPCYMAISEST
ncbi:hypothetical protein U3516DRAFT_785187 [Neocallimastix sp. 'constans']